MKSAALTAPLPTPRVSPIGILLGSGRPPAVAGLVPTAVVDAVDGVVLAGARVHVGEEVPEAAPPFTDGDATGAVAGVRGVPGVVAAAPHCLPGDVREGLGLAVFVGRRPLSGVGRELGARLVRVFAREAGRTGLVLAGIAQGVLCAGAVIGALQGSATRGRELPALRGLADAPSSFRGRRVASASAALGAGLADLGVALTGAVRKTLRHTSMIANPPVFRCIWRAA